MKASDNVPETPVWWSIISPSTRMPVYTKERLWFDARRNFGGECDPVRVMDVRLVAELDAMEAAPVTKAKKPLSRE